MRKKNSTACPMCKAQHSYTFAEAMKIQAATYGKLRRLISGLKPQQLAFRPAEDKWSIKEVITHLADTELVYGFRYRKLLAEDGPEASPFDEKLWAQRLSPHARNLKAVLEMFRAVRQNNLDVLKVTPETEWQRGGVHPAYGPLTVEQLMLHLTMHDLNHMEQIRRIRAAIRAGG